MAQEQKIDDDDVHAKLMRKYLEVPQWWYAVLFVVFFAIAVAFVEVWHTDVPVYAILLSVTLAAIFIIPNGLILATTGQPVGINILAEIIAGVISPGNPLFNMIFKTFAVQTLTEAENFLLNLKLGHYLKIPPRATFIVQIVGTFAATCVETSVASLISANIHDICTPEQKSLLICAKTETFLTASTIWGLIGPIREFDKHGLYRLALYALLVGALLPLPLWAWRRRFPNSRLSGISSPLLLAGNTNVPPAVGIGFSSWIATGFIFQYLIKKRNFAWWSKYNYLTSSGLDCGTCIAILAIFFLLANSEGRFNRKLVG